MLDDGRILDPATRTEGETLDLPEGVQGFRPGQVLGERYEIRGLLGRGGMGEVWHAFDLKLRVEVALKALRPEFFRSERRLELLRDEVRSAREVVSPNVCRIFDLIEIDGRELVSMEYVDGATLLAVLTERGPLELKEAQDIASQFLAGLEAIHKVGLVHRDIKPENIMLTRAGRVVVMDFGLARQETEGGGSVSGTPAYMSPEQAAGQTLDARADVYSAGVVLAEMVCPDGIRNLQSRQSVWEGVRSEPAKVPDTPWAAVIKKALAKDRDARFHTAHTLTRALEDVTLRVEGAEDLHPYPGLASFTEEDAEYFFGREAEVEQMWRKLEGPPRMLGLVGPSGAGKTSFLRAGMIPTASSRWAVLRCTPGDSAVASLRRTLVPALSGANEALSALATGEDDATVSAFATWRAGHGRALLVVDQFEELFTLNPTHVHVSVADVLSRLPVEADVHVLLSMRDDFLMGANRYQSLRAMVPDLTLLGAPTGDSLRRALTQPALQCGYRFEDDELVDEMLAEVEGERGALPLLAFAAARLWDKRDRESGLLTRQAYQDIGGVGGALARHAEATIDQIGHERIPMVRELFRNLVTAEGTRAVREWDELLSVFEDPQRESAEEVLRELIDARLLTSYEVKEDDREPTRRVEIIHESLLANWPRLVRWQTQDADAVQLRDQLRQAARTWDEHDRSDDLLWTGSAYREYTIWRERYPGGLSELEDDFAQAMTSLATRRRRYRRIAAVAGLVVFASMAVVFAVLWRRSVLEARRAEAARLAGIARLEMREDPTVALAWTIASLETADTALARELAVESLWRGPLYSVMARDPDLPVTFWMAFSPDGEYLAGKGQNSREVVVWSSSGEPTVVSDDRTPQGVGGPVTFTEDSTLLVVGDEDLFRVWSVPDWNLVRELTLPEEASRDEKDCSRWQVLDDERLLVFSCNQGRFLVRSWPLREGGPTTHGWWEPESGARWAIDRQGAFIAFSRGPEVILRPLESLETTGNDRMIGRHDGPVHSLSFSPSGDRVAAFDETGVTRLWPTNPESGIRPSVLQCFDEPGLGFANRNLLQGFILAGFGVRDVRWPPDTAARHLPHPPENTLWRQATQLHGPWQAARSDYGEVLFWPLLDPYPRILRGHSSFVYSLEFIGAGDGLATASNLDNTLRRWPLSADAGELARVLWQPSFGLTKVVSDPDGERLLVSNFFFGGDVFLVPISDTPQVETLWHHDRSRVWSAAFSHDGRRAAAAAAAGRGNEDVVIRVWDLQSGEEQVIPLRGPDDSAEGDPFHRGVVSLRFTPAGDLLSAGSGGVRFWDLDTGASEWLAQVPDPGWMAMDATSDGRLMLTAENTGWGDVDYTNLTLHNRESGSTRTITTHGPIVHGFTLHPDGSAIVTSRDTVVRVGPVDGSEPHLLFGHDAAVCDIEVSPDGRWIASGGRDTTIRLWPMPDLSKPPLHTLPREELIARLKTFTNLRVVPDPESPVVWKLEVGPFPGWKTVPEW